MITEDKKNKLRDEFKKLRKNMKKETDPATLKAMISMERFFLQQIARHTPEDVHLYV